MTPFLAAFIAVDAIIGVAVFVFLLKRRMALLAELAGVLPAQLGLGSLQALSAFARQQHPRIGEWMRANWSGMPDQLPPAITSLLGQLEHDAQAKGLSVERPALKAMLASSLREHRIGSFGVLSEAFKRVA